MPRADQKLQTIQQLYNYPQNISKASTVGFIIDSTNAYFDDNKHRFVKKIKIVDQSFNVEHYNPHQKFHYMTVFFYAPKIQDLPNPRFIGDIIYLRRFSFGKYNQNFQGHYIDAPYCSWALISSQTNNDNINEYQTSKSDMHLDNQDKYPDLSLRVSDLRRQSQSYLSRYSVVNVLPSGMKTKDVDYIVKVIKRTSDGVKLIIGKKQYIFKNTTSFVQQGSIGKLRSVLRIQKHQKYQQIIPNLYTSLIQLRQSSFDAQLIRRRDNQVHHQRQGEIFTTLSQLNSLPLSTQKFISGECQNKKYYVNVQVFKSSAQDFTQAIKYYDQKKNTLSDIRRKQTYPIYNFYLVCQDESISKQHKFTQIHLYSFDRTGQDLLQRVQLQNLGQFSNHKQENIYFARRIQNLLNSPSVNMTVQVLSDGKGNRLLRAVHIA